MRIGFLIFNLDGMGGTSRSAITQANALARDHDVRLTSVTRSADAPHYEVADSIEVDYLLDVRDGSHPRLDTELMVVPDVGHDVAGFLHRRESALVPARWDRQFSCLSDVALEAYLPELDLDILITVTPGLLACAAQLAPPSTVLVHQEHRSSSDRTDGLEPLLTFAPRADVVALLTPGVETWLREQLGELAPTTVVMPNPLPLGFVPQSTREHPLIVTGGRLAPEKQFVKLVKAFAQVADQIPEWRLRICGEGGQRDAIVREIRRFDLWDRVELPGRIADMRSQWAQASIAALTSRTEGFPLVVQEAMAAGVPVASFDCPSGPREIIEHEVDGLLVAPQSVTGMAAALLRLASDDGLRHRLGEAARRSSEQYDAGLISRRWEQIFTEAISHRGGLAQPLALARDHRRVRHRPIEPVESAEEIASAGVTPAEARRTALACAVAAAEAAGSDWFVIPPHERPAPTVVMPISERAAFLAELADADVPAYLSLRDPAAHSWPERRGTVADLAADLRHGMTSSVVLEPWPEVDDSPSLIGQGCSVEVEFWDVDTSGDLVAPWPNAYADRVPTDAATTTTGVSGHDVPTLPLMVGPTAFECAFPIDVVYTWVDGADPAWSAAREARLRDSGEAAARPSASGAARFADRDELRHSMRSMHLFAPWVRTIHLVTAGQVPDWLDVDHPQIHLVDHTEILPADALPTFNSHAIETGLHRIPGLSEQFIYVNDDVFLGRPLRPEHFFDPAGRNACYIAPRTVGAIEDPADPPWIQANWNVRRLLADEFGITLTHHLAHTPHPQRVSTLTELATRFADDVASTARTAFRSSSDISPTSALAPHVGLALGAAYVGETAHQFVDLSAPDVERRLRQLLGRDQDFFCLGDHHQHALPESRLRAVLADFYAAYVPIAAPWELTGERAAR